MHGVGVVLVGGIRSRSCRAGRAGVASAQRGRDAGPVRADGLPLPPQRRVRLRRWPHAVLRRNAEPPVHMLNLSRPLACALLLFGCGASQMVLKDPIANKCANSGLQGCDELTDGILLYVDGNKVEGEAKLKQGAAANSPDKVKAFAQNLEPIMQLPGVSSYSGSLKAVIHILATSADAHEPTEAGQAATAAKTTQEPQAGHATVAPAVEAATTVTLPPNLDISRLRTRTFFPATDDKATTCDEGILAAPNRTCTRVKAFLGPLVLTNVHLSAGCPDELLIFSEGSEHSVRWILATPPGVALTVNGGGLLVPQDDVFYVGARSNVGPLHKDVRCAVTFSGWRPKEADLFPSTQ